MAIKVTINHERYSSIGPFRHVWLGKLDDFIHEAHGFIGSVIAFSLWYLVSAYRQWYWSRLAAETDKRYAAGAEKRRQALAKRLAKKPADPSPMQEFFNG